MAPIRCISANRTPWHALAHFGTLKYALERFGTLGGWGGRGGNDQGPMIRLRFRLRRGFGERESYGGQAKAQRSAINQVSKNGVGKQVVRIFPHLPGVGGKMTEAKVKIK